MILHFDLFFIYKILIENYFLLHFCEFNSLESRDLDWRSKSNWMLGIQASIRTFGSRVSVMEKEFSLSNYDHCCRFMIRVTIRWWLMLVIKWFSYVWTYIYIMCMVTCLNKWIFDWDVKFRTLICMLWVLIVYFWGNSTLGIDMLDVDSENKEISMRSTKLCGCRRDKWLFRHNNRPDQLAPLQ